MEFESDNDDEVQSAPHGTGICHLIGNETCFTILITKIIVLRKSDDHGGTTRGREEVS